MWLDVGRNIDPRLVTGADWAPLAAALERASRAGYDVQQHLPRLATHSPLPELRPARALHYRLVDECQAAITPLTERARQAEDAAALAAATSRLRTEAERIDNQRAAQPSGMPKPAGPGKVAPAPPAARPHPAERKGPQR